MANEDISENQSTGYVKIFRSLKKNWIWEDPIKLKWWLDILLEVNYSDRKVLIGGTLIDCKRGQSLYSLETWAKRWRVDKSKVRRFFYLLKSDNMIVLENVTKTTRITVCKYECYNDNQHEDETIMKRKRNASETLATPNKKDNKEKKDNNVETGKENIQISGDEYNKLLDELGDAMAIECIDYLSDYKLEKGYKTKSDYLSIKRWVIKAVTEKRSKVKYMNDDQRRSGPALPKLNAR